MKTKIVIFFMSLFLMSLTLSACGKTNTGDLDRSSDRSLSREMGASQESKQEEAQMEKAEKRLSMKINDRVVDVSWEDNESVAVLRALCEKAPLEIQMSRYGGFEQVGPLGQELPRQDVEITTAPGDIVLYSGNQLVVFYGSNSWAYTRLGHITNLDNKAIADLLSSGDVTIQIGREDIQ